MRIFSRTDHCHLKRTATSILIAAALMLTSMHATAEDASEFEDDKWHFSIVPYLWLASIDGDTGAGGVETQTSRSSSLLSLDNLESFGFVGLAARRNRWGIATDFVAIRFEDGFQIGPTTTEYGLNGSLFEIIGTYRPARFQHTDILFGARRVEMEVDINLTPGPEAAQSKVWADPIVGARYRRRFSDRWFMSLRGDVGGFGVSSDFTVNALAAVGFDMTKHLALQLGYRYTMLDFKEDEFLVDLSVHGYLLGLKIQF